MSESIQLDEATVSILQTVRRANAGVLGCIAILNEHDANQGSVPGSIGPFIRLEPDQEMGLLFAIEAFVVGHRRSRGAPGDHYYGDEDY